jgi:hypothetical protein
MLEPSFKYYALLQVLKYRPYRNWGGAPAAGASRRRSPQERPEINPEQDLLI